MDPILYLRTMAHDQGNLYYEQRLASNNNNNSSAKDQ